MLLVHIDLFLKRKQLKKKHKAAAFLSTRPNWHNSKLRWGWNRWHDGIAHHFGIIFLAKLWIWSNYNTEIIPTVSSIVGVYFCLVQLEIQIQIVDHKHHPVGEFVAAWMVSININIAFSNEDVFGYVDQKTHLKVQKHAFPSENHRKNNFTDTTYNSLFFE